VTTPKAQEATLLESYTPPGSGSTTPTAAASDTRVSRAFLGLSPFADFLRARYPSASTRSTSAKTVPGSTEEGGGAGSGGTAGSASQSGTDAEGNDDESDRRTIRGVSVGGEGKAVNGHAENQEKLNDSVAALTGTTVI
jgi:hypothetical protein